MSLINTIGYFSIVMHKLEKKSPCVRTGRNKDDVNLSLGLVVPLVDGGGHAPAVVLAVLVALSLGDPLRASQ